MSFSELAKSGYVRRQKEVKISLSDGKELVFTATEISWFQRVELATMMKNGEDMNMQLVIFSIKDADGKHMTPEQAAALNPKHLEAFYLAAVDVNALNEEPKKKAE